MPFHAFLTTWLGDTFGHRSAFQAWKDVLIILLLLFTAIGIFSKTQLRNFLLKDRLNQLIIAYALVHFITILAFKPEPVAANFALKTNLGFLALLIAAQAVSWLYQPTKVARTLSTIILVSGGVVAVFGTLQALVLPPDWLKSFGYGPGTILPFLPISGSSEFTRILATLGGPNQLGQYLIIPITVASWLAVSQRKYWLLILLVPMLISLFFSFSRSAWLGVAASMAVLLLAQIGWKKFAITILSLAIIGTGLVFSLAKSTNNQTFNLLVHHGSNEQSTSNVERSTAIQTAVTEIRQHPFGIGPGRAGPASFQLRRTTGFITENYYLQLALEIGLIGLGLFLVILVLVGLKLWAGPKLGLGVPLAASLVGISVVNLFLHGWADSTSALVWWGTVGLIIKKPPAR